MKEIPVKEAVGQVLCHDITQIIRDVSKGPVFRKGHIIREEDIPVLLSVGKEHIYVWEKQEGILHENEAAEILRDICISENMIPSEPKEGKIELRAETDGLFKIRKDRMLQVNLLGEMLIATRHANTPVKKGDVLAGTRVIPLVIEAAKMERAKEAAGPEPLLRIMPYQHKKVGIVVTGSEILKERIKDTFNPVVLEKLQKYPVEVLGQIRSGDDKERISEAIENFIRQGADLVICTGGMSVDPDDRTPGAIAATGAETVTYGAPVLPGAMMMVAYWPRAGKTDAVITGLPGCVMYAKQTIFDLLLPRIMADDRITREEIAELGIGGLCLNCAVCTYPNCGFGKA